VQAAAVEMASEGNQHCANCISTLSFPIRHGTGSLGQSPGHIGHLPRPGHRVIIWTRCETRVFPVFEKCPKCNAEMTSHCQVSVVGLKSLDVSLCYEYLPMIIKNSLA